MWFTKWIEGLELKKFAKYMRMKKLICLMAAVVVILTSFGFYAEQLNNYIKTESLKRLEESAKYSSTIINNDLFNKRENLKYMSNVIMKQKIPQQFKKEHLQMIMDNIFTNAGVIYRQNDVNDVEVLKGTLPDNIEQQQFFFDGMDGKETLTVFNNELLYSMPLWDKNQQIIGVIFATFDIDTMANMMSVNIFDDRGFSVLIDEHGNKLVSGKNTLKVKSENRNVFVNPGQVSEKNKENIKILQSELMQSHSGIIEFQAYEPIEVYYQPLGIGNLYLLTVIANNVIMERYNVLMRYSTYLFIIVLIMMIAVLIMLMIAERKKQKEMADILYVDKLTGGYSYEKFLQKSIEWIKEDKESNKAVIIFDVDNFKLINVIFGYDQGDKILSDIWCILNKHLKGRGFFAHKYGDLFSIIVKYKDLLDLKNMCVAIANDTMQLNLTDKKAFKIVPSMGIYLLEQNDTNLELMQNYAIMARRYIKDKYDIHHAFYTDDIKAEIISRKTIVDDICNALTNREFYPYFQPQYDAKTKKLISAEALIRWIKPNGKMVSPVQFIPLAEEVGIIIDIDEYMFEAVCKQQSLWQQQGYDIVPISVNISRYRLYHSNFIQECMEILNKYNLSTKVIQLEITEGTLLEELDVSEQLVNKLRDLGFSVLIDDFGMGYSSISMVKDINATELKIDKSFIDDMSDKGRKIMEYVIKIANTMNMKTVAEGVETKEQYEFLRDNNCDIIQGYYFAKPMPVGEFTELLKQKT